MLAEDILLEIDTTLNQLIKNAEAIQTADMSTLSETVVDAFQKTQESLLQHLMHMDQFLITRKESFKVLDTRSASFKLQEKMRRFEKLKATYNKQLPPTQSRWLLSKRKNKKLLSAY